MHSVILPTTITYLTFRLVLNYSSQVGIHNITLISDHIKFPAFKTKLNLVFFLGVISIV